MPLGKFIDTGPFDPSEILELKSAIQGEVLTPGTDRYEAARQVYNAMIDRHPALIIRCAG